MVKEIKVKGKKYFRCDCCRLLYKEKKSAQEHEDLCKKSNPKIKKLLKNGK